MIDGIFEIIDEMPNYISYIYPGFITIWIFCFLRGNRFKMTKSALLLSVCISFFYISSMQYFLVPFINEKLSISYISSDIKNVKFNIVLFILAVIIPYLVYQIITWEDFDLLLRNVEIYTSVQQNEFDVLQEDYEQAIFITMYLKNTNISYSGYLKQKDMDKDSRRFLCLWKYRKFIVMKNGKLKRIEDHTKDDKERVIIYYDDISCFEVSNIDK